MKLPALPVIIRGNSAAALEKVQRDLAIADARLVQLGADRLAALEAGDDGIDAARKIDAEIANTFGTIAAYRDKLVILERKAAQEKQECAADQYRQAVAAVEKPLAR